MEKAALYAFMVRFRYGVISSTSRQGTPQSALVGIAVTPDLEIIFDTLRSTRKYRNLIGRPLCSFVVGWDGEQTVQLEGAAFELRDAELSRALEAYFCVWPDGRERMTWPGITHFLVRPTWIRYSDYNPSPPLIEEVSFAPRSR
jgi:hypothetical protein